MGPQKIPYIYKRPQARKYEDVVHKALVKQGVRPISKGTEVAVLITWYRCHKRGDVDNKFKIVLDSLQSGRSKWGCYENDSQIADLRIVRITDPSCQPHIVVAVQEIGDAGKFTV